jgi:hypothetical protein
MAKALEEVAKDLKANPDEWCVLFSPVTSDNWINIEFWSRDHGWERIL